MKKISLKPKRTVLVVGASGRLGRVLRGFWPDDVKPIWHSRQPRAGFVLGDLLTPSAPLRAAAAQADVILCFAGATPASGASTSALLGQHRALAMSALQLAKESDVARVLVASSSAVYGGTSRAMEETAACLPVSAYGRAKREMEQAALMLSAEIDQPMTVLRIGNVLGCDAIIGGWIPGFELDTWPGGLTPRRSYIGPRYFTQVISRLCADMALPNILNVAAKGAVSTSDLLTAAGVEWTSRAPAAGALPQVVMSTALLAQVLGEPISRVDPAEMIAEWRALPNNDLEGPRHAMA